METLTEGKMKKMLHKKRLAANATIEFYDSVDPSEVAKVCFKISMRATGLARGMAFL